jgi:protein-S-isoprenylcysteine O-methyltransferase Ste14
MHFKNNIPSNKPRTLVLPPVPYAIAIALGWWLDRRVTPLSLNMGVSTQVMAVLISATGILLMLLTAWELYRHQTTVNPYSSASHLCVSGVFGLSRNPIYVGDWLVLIGASLWLMTFWPLIFSPIVWIIIRYGVIRHEEAHLEAKFGQEYRDYTRRVRRWI